MGREDRQVEEIWRSLEREATGERFEEGMVEGLPEPGRRYLPHAIEPGTRLASSVAMKMKGRMRLARERGWMPMQGEEILAMPGGFVWKASVGGWLRVVGSDLYAAGEGQMRWRLWGIVPLVKAGGADVTRSARGRLAAELTWLPSALLPDRGACWETVDEETARASVRIDGEPFDLRLSIGPDGALKKARIERWGNVETEGGGYDLIAFGAVVLEERKFGGYTIPSRIQAGWRPDTERYFEFFEAELLEASYR